MDLPPASGRAATQQAPKESHDHSCSEEPSSLTTMTARITARTCVRAHIHVDTFQDRPADKLYGDDVSISSLVTSKVVMISQLGL